jgi:hypothetical protein
MWPALLAGVVIAALAATGAASAVEESADMSVKWEGLVVGPPKGTVGRPFLLMFGLLNAGPDVGHVRINVQTPAGVRRVGGALECQPLDSLVLHCDELDAVVGSNRVSRISFTADRPGSYTFTVFLDKLGAADPDPSNNTDTITVSVAAAPVTATAAAVAPARPMAGSSFVASFAVAGGTIEAVRCATSVGTAHGRASGGRAACTVRTPRTAAGRTARVTVGATVGGRTFTRTISVRLH